MPLHRTRQIETDEHLILIEVLRQADPITVSIAEKSIFGSALSQSLVWELCAAAVRKHPELEPQCADRYGSSSGRDYKRQALSQHTLSNSRRNDEAPKAAYDHKTSQSRLNDARDTQIEQTAWQGRVQPHTALPHYSQLKAERHPADHDADVRQRDRSTHRDRITGRFVAPHSQHYDLPMQEGIKPAAYQQGWPSRDQQRPPGPNPFRGGGKWKHDLFEELTKPAAAAGQNGATKTAVDADSTRQLMLQLPASENR